MKATGTYGPRGRVHTIETGIRLVAPTMGRARIRTHSAYCGEIVVDSQAERLVAHMLAIDPAVASYRPQPFSVDLIGWQILSSKEQVKAFRARYGRHLGPRIYTPDFCISWSGARKTALEVKTAGYQGDEQYEERLRRAGEVLSAHGYELAKVVTPENTRSPIKQNLQLLQQAKRLLRDALPAEMAEKLEVLEGRELSLGMVCSHLNLPLAHSPTLILSGVVSLDLMAHPLHADSPVRLAYGDLTHLHLLEKLL